jgi:transcriptional regulator with XRE-family HTH domain
MAPKDTSSDGGASPGAHLPNRFSVPYLKAWRAARGMTQRELAQRAGCVEATVRRIEGGRMAQVLNAAELARALDVPLDALRHTDPTLQP